MGATRVGPQATREYLARMRERYERARREAKGGLLDEVCEVTGYHRKAVIRLLRRPGGDRADGGGAAGGWRTAAEVVTALRAIWTAAGLSVVGAAEGAAAGRGCRGRAAGSRLTPATERALLRISARQIDRRLQPYKQELRTRMYGRTKPGTLLKHHIPGADGAVERHGSRASRKSIWSRIRATAPTANSCTRSM